MSDPTPYAGDEVPPGMPEGGPGRKYKGLRDGEPCGPDQHTIVPMGDPRRAPPDGEVRCPTLAPEIDLLLDLLPADQADKVHAGLVAAAVRSASRYRFGTAPTVPGEGGGGSIPLMNPQTGRPLIEVDAQLLLKAAERVAKRHGLDAPQKQELRHEITDSLAERLAKARSNVTPS